MYLWIVVVLAFAAVFALTYCFGEEICRGMAGRFAVRRRRWRHLEMGRPQGRDPVEG